MSYDKHPSGPYARFLLLLVAFFLVLLSTSIVRAAPSANGMVHAVTGMEHANYHATKNCSGSTYTTYAMTPQPGTFLIPVEVTTLPGVEAFYERAARQNVKWLDTVDCTTSNINFQASQPPESNVNITNNSTNWSGYQIGGGTAPANHYAQGGWNVPYVSTPQYQISATGYFMSATWVGLGGGYNSNFSAAHPIIQAGTIQQVDSRGNASYYFLYQIYDGNQPSHVINQISVNPGDDVGAVLVWIPENNTAVLGVCNWRTSTCVNFNVFQVGEPSNSVEWIMEAPSVGTPGVIQSLPKFSNVNFINTCWAATTTYSATPNSGVALPLTGSSGLTGSHSLCQAPIYGPSLLQFIMYLSPLYGSNSLIISTPGPLTTTTNGSNESSSNFTITN